MNSYRRILVEMNSHEQDRALVLYAALITRLARAPKTYFLNVARDLRIPAAVMQDYSEILEPVGDFIAQRMRNQAELPFAHHAENVLEFEVCEGQPVGELISRVRQMAVDLLIVGGGVPKKGAKCTAIQVVRKVACSVLFVPENSPGVISRILVAVDFSDYSRNAVEVAATLADALEIPAITLLHAYSVPPRYYKAGRTFEEFAGTMQRNARSNYESFIKRTDIGNVEAIPLFTLAKKPGEAICKQVKRDKFDLVVLGTRGRKAGVSLLLRSVTENAIKALDVPVLAVKQKKDAWGLLEVLKHEARLS